MVLGINSAVLSNTRCKLLHVDICGLWVSAAECLAQNQLENGDVLIAVMTCRVDGVLMAGQQHGMSLADMASAAVTGQQHSSLGTAVYLLASLFNHSCTPNLDVTFPANNSEHSTPRLWPSTPLSMTKASLF